MGKQKQSILLSLTFLLNLLLQGCGFKQQFVYALQKATQASFGLATEVKKENYTLFEAAERGELAITLKLLSTHQANMQDANAMTALHYTILNGHLHIAQVLLTQYNANPNIADYFNRTPLHYLVEPQYIASQSYANSGIDLLTMVKLFIAKDANQQLPDNLGRTPFSIAFWGQQLDILKIFSAKLTPHDLNEFQFEYDKPHYYQIRDVANIPQLNPITALHAIVSTDAIDIAEWLLQQGTDMNKGDLYGVRPLHRAIAYGNAAMVKLFLARGADPKLLDHYGNNALHFLSNFLEYKTASYEGYKRREILQLLLNAGVSNDPNQDGQTPWHFFAKMLPKQYACLDLLIHYRPGNNFLICDKENHTFLDLIKAKDHVVYLDLYETLREKYLSQLKEFLAIKNYDEFLSIDNQLILKLMVDYILLDLTVPKEMPAALIRHRYLTKLEEFLATDKSYYELLHVGNRKAILSTIVDYALDLQ